MKSMWSFFENYFTPEECKILTLKCLNMGLKEGNTTSVPCSLILS